MKTKPDRKAILMIIDRTADSTTVGYKHFDLNAAGMQSLIELIRDAGDASANFDVFQTYSKKEKKA